MLLHLAIKNIILVDYINLEFSPGFSVFTGETGAGKSIILDSLAFALGDRAKKDFICNNAEFGEVVACFDISKQKELIDLFNSKKITLKRIQYKNGKTKCFVNEHSINLSTLRDIGLQLVEFHGQHADRALLKKIEHLRILDEFFDIKKEKQNVANAFTQWQMIQKNLLEKENILATINKEQDYLTAAAEELQALNVQKGEEEELSAKRSLLIKQQKLSSLMSDIQDNLNLSNSPSAVLTEIWRKLDRYPEEKYTKPLLETLDVALNNVAIFEEEVNNLVKDLKFDEDELERIEERLFALRAVARKYSIQIDNLPELCEKITEKIYLIENAELELNKIKAEQTKCEKLYFKEANVLSELRKKVANNFMEAVMKELPDLKLEYAKFFINIESGNKFATKNGIDNVEFYVQTNPNTKMGPILEVASGGELSRFLLAIKVVLSNINTIPTIIFDEIDTGLSGGVAASIGVKLKKIAQNVQLIAITHLPQVASKADAQFVIDKKLVANENRLTSTVKKLNNKERIEEIARMLSGNDITKEARASAQSLINA